MNIAEPVIGTPEEHLAARTRLLEREKQLTRLRDELAAERHRLPWTPVTAAYRFHTEAGETDLAGLFGGRSQLLVYHFMFGPDWEEGCPSCSFWADSFDGLPVHLAHRDVAFTAISRAPLDRLLAYRRRMGWTFPWVSSANSTFNADFGVSFEPGAAGATYNFRPIADPGDELPGLSAFALRDGVVYHTYSCYSRGIDAINAAYQLLDLAPQGRDEGAEPHAQAWVRRHDRYDT
jgi:predicted dithiol-disulfide oxidoreductase (DUF899 family)